MGYRLPLDSLPWQTRQQQVTPRDSFEGFDALDPAGEIARRYSLFEPPTPYGVQIQPQTSANEETDHESIPHTALCIEPRAGRLWVFLPPLSHLEHPR